MLTVSQTLKIYELLNQHFKDEEVAKALVEEIILVMDTKPNLAKDKLVSNSNLLDTKTDLTNEIRRLETKIGQRFKDQLKWFFILMGLSALIIALIKLA